MDDLIKFLRTLRAVEREAAKHGYYGDLLADDVPLIGTLNEQMAISTIGCDTSPGRMTTKERELHNRLVRAAVLTGRKKPSGKLPEGNGEARARRPRKW